MTIKGETFITNIHRLNDKGQGQAAVWRKNEKGNERKLRLTIPYTLVGEDVQVTVERPEKRRWKCKPDKIITPHSQRVEARCPHFELCGGCIWQHFSYEGQLETKTNYVKEMVRSEGFDDNLVAHTLGMDEPWFYRNKMEFTFATDGSLGLHEQGNFRRIIPLETCFLMHEEMKEAVLEIAHWVKKYEYSGYNKETHEGIFRHVMVRRGFKTGEILLAIFATESPENIAYVDELVQIIETKYPSVKGLLWLENRDWADRAQAEAEHVLLGRDFIYDELMGYRYRLWFDTFFQPNPKQAENLVDYAMEFADVKETDTMIDLFCGVGTFSLPFAKRVKSLAGIEIVETSIESAKRNAKDNGIDNTYFLAKDARHGIDEVLEQFGTPDVLLLDPPRSGAGGKVMRRIGRAQPERVVYVSCNPASFAIDIKELSAFGYKLEKVQPVDQFPQTHHVELVALMSREETLI